MLEMKHVSKTFNPGTVNEKKALCDLNLVLEDGDFATIVGSNGAGKSTTFNAITGAFYVDEGQIILDGEDITYKKEFLRSKVIGHLFQDPLKGTAPHMTIEENMALAYLRASGKENAFFSRIRKSDKEKFRELLSQLDMGLEDRMNNFPAQLSGGEQQRVSIARALAKSPKLLLCDEPTGALDYNTGKTILKLLQDTCREKGMTVVVITHNQAITPMADRVIKIKNSKVAKISLNPNPTPVENIEW